MSKTLMVYFSQGGTTARVAEQIAAGLRAADYQVDLCNVKDERPPALDGYDLLGIGSPVYYYRPPFNVMDYVNGLPGLDGLPAFVFMLHGTYRGDASNAIRRALARKGAEEVGYFYCLGADYALLYLKEGYLFSPDHPTAEELAQAQAFGERVAARVAGEQYVRPREDRPPPSLVYRLERFMTNRWLARQVYSRLFKVNAENCTACGACAKLCPTGNIAEDKDGRPTWGRDCLLCLTCELKCPEDAITSPSSWLLFRPFTIYNVRRAAQDPALDHVQVIHSRGRTRRMECEL
jgi:flavodoxin/Pyruvate/2-oxoacid:ferredoxin oxidoreductase delta subunit